MAAEGLAEGSKTPVPVLQAPSWGGARLLLAAIEPVSPALPPSPRPLSLQWHSKRQRQR